jgi:hypothetical protein
VLATVHAVVALRHISAADRRSEAPRTMDAHFISGSVPEAVPATA